MKVVIDGIACEAEYGEYILEVAKRNGIDIPALCHNDALRGIGTCRLCMVELVEGDKAKLAASCLYPITRELDIRTDSSKVYRIRKTIMKLLLSRAPENEHLNSLAQKYGLQPAKLPELYGKEEACMLCGLCVKACEELGANAISTVCRGTGKKVSTPFDEPSPDCIGCGSCAQICPMGAVIMDDRNGFRSIWGKTFELLKCERCGQYCASQEYIHFMEKKLGRESGSIYCSNCKKFVSAEKFRDIYSK